MTESEVSSTDLDELVGEWLTLPDLAEALAVEVSKTRRMVDERVVVGIRRGGRPLTFQVPAKFIVPAHLADPANALPPLPEGGFAVLTSLQGTLSVLSDIGFEDREAIEWLFSVNDELGEAPIEALRAGRKAHVRRVAQSLA